MKIMKLLSFGEILFDVFPNSSHIGGAPLNFAAHAAKQGADAWMISAVGGDSLGKEALQRLKSWNINTQFVNVHPDKQTGKCLVTLDENSIPTYNLRTDVAYDFIPVPQVNDTFDILYFGTLSLRSEYNLHTVKSLLEKSVCKDVFVDMNIRPPFFTETTVDFALRNATIVKISDEELPAIIETIFGLNDFNIQYAIKLIAQKYSNLKLVILTCGADGSSVYDISNGKTYNCAATPATVVSTVGAGDSFSATFITNYWRGATITQALKRASEISAFVVSNEEAVPEY